MDDGAAGAASPAGEDRPAGIRDSSATDPPADGDRDFVLEDGEDMDEGEDGEAAAQEEESQDAAPSHAAPPAADGEGEGSYGSGASSPGSPSTADSDLDAEVEMEDDDEDDDDDADDGSGVGEEEDPPPGRHGATAAKVPAASRPEAAAGGEPTGGEYPLSDGADDDGEAVEVRKPRRQRAPIVIPPDLLRRSTRARAEVRRYTVTPPTSAEPSSADPSDDDDFQAAENGKPTEPVSARLTGEREVGVGSFPSIQHAFSTVLALPVAAGVHLGSRLVCGEGPTSCVASFSCGPDLAPLSPSTPVSLSLFGFALLLRFFSGACAPSLPSLRIRLCLPRRLRVPACVFIHATAGSWCGTNPNPSANG